MKQFIVMQSFLALLLVLLMPIGLSAQVADPGTGLPAGPLITDTIETEGEPVDVEIDVPFQDVDDSGEIIVEEEESPQEVLVQNEEDLATAEDRPLIDLSGDPAEDFAQISASQSFRDGVVRFHLGRFNAAISDFLRVLSINPGDALAREWLGRSYFFSGFEDAALSQWDLIAQSGTARPYLLSFIERVENRKGLAGLLRSSQEYVKINEFQGLENSVLSLNRPTSLYPRGDGSVFVTNFATNQLLVMNPNGRIVQTFRGGFQPLEGPFDITIANDELVIVSNFAGDTISLMDLNGNGIGQFGEKGIGPGQFLGPMYLTTDGRYIYVSDWGNQRIQKFDLEGNYILEFGQPALLRADYSIRPSFEGFYRPMGMEWVQGRLWVLDNQRDGIKLFSFDQSGNLLRTIPLDTLENAEDLTKWDDDSMIITSDSGVYHFEIARERLELLWEPQDNGRWISARMDDNGHIQVSNYDTNRVEILSPLSELSAGLHIQINRIDSSNFPNVYAEVFVSDNQGRPLQGLEVANFLMTERGLGIAEWEVVYRGYRSADVSTTVLIEGSSGMENFRRMVSETLGQLSADLEPLGPFTIISAGISPVIEYSSDSIDMDATEVMNGFVSDRQWSFDLGLRLSVGEVLMHQRKRHIVFIGTGSLPEWAFDRYGLIESANYLRNNGVHFSFIQLDSSKTISPSLEYLVSETGGQIYDINNPEQMSRIVSQIQRNNDGVYGLQFLSQEDGDFGRSYMPIEIEARLLNRSGRDESGYFTPLEF